MPGPLDHVPMERVRLAVEKLAEAGQQALEFFEDGQWEASALEVERAAEAVNTVRAVRREAKAEAESAKWETGFDPKTLRSGDEFEVYVIASNDGWEWVAARVRSVCGSTLHLRYADGDERKVDIERFAAGHRRRLRDTSTPQHESGED